MLLTKPLVLSAALLLGSSLPALAQKLSVTPAPGLWEHSMKITLNGQDMMATVRAAQAQAMQQLQSLPPEQREMMLKMMQGAMGGLGAPQRSCVTPEQARAAADPEALMRQMTEDGDGAQDCRYEVQAVSGNTLTMRAQCRPQDGWNGTMTGTMTLHDAKRWTGRFQGQGRMQGELPPGLTAPGGAVDMVMDSSGRWLSADCGGLAPQR